MDRPPLKNVISMAHHLIEAKEMVSAISNPEMANRLDVKKRTYIEYRRGTNAPIAMKTILNLISELDEQDILRIIRYWKNEQH